MGQKWRKWLACLGALSLLAACNGGGDVTDSNRYPGSGGQTGGGSDSGSRPVAAFQAAIGTTVLVNGATVQAGDRVVLDASSSSTSSGRLSYKWTVVRQPGVDEIENPQSARAAFVPSSAGEYVIQLSVDNGSGFASQELTFTATSEYPVAIVERRERDMRLGMVQLDGRASQPPTGGAAARLQYAWRLTSVPPDSAIKALASDEATQAQPRFTADIPGKYEFQLNVSYEGKTSLKPATLVVNILEPLTEPIAVITSRSVEPYLRGEKVTFDASQSTPGQNGGALQYRWTVAAQGNAPQPVVEGANSAVMSFTPNSISPVDVNLTIFDGVQYGDSNMLITPVRPAGSPNTPPVAVFLPGLGLQTFEIEKAAKTSLYARSSYDIDELGNTTFFYEWTLLEEPAPGAATIDRPGNGRMATFTPRRFEGDGAETYKFQLRVQDADGAWSEPVVRTFTVRNGANRAPEAHAGPARGANTSFLVGTDVELLGVGTDMDNNRIIDYAWSLIDRPDNSRAALVNPTTERPRITLDQPGRYVITFAVKDSRGVSSVLPATVTLYAKTVNYPPEARPALAAHYDREQPLLINKTREKVNAYNTTSDFWSEFAIRSNAYDIDGDKVEYFWSLTGVPDGYPGHNRSSAMFTCFIGESWSSAQQAGLETADNYMTRQAAARDWTTCSDLRFGPSKTGIYDITLWISDGSENSGPFNFSMNAATREDFPTLLLETFYQNHRWNSQTASLELVKEPNMTTYTSAQMTFPATDGARFFSSKQPYLCDRDAIAAGADFVIDTYRLTAGQSNYTITNLKAVDTGNGALPSFIGLKEGQVIEAGKSVDFSVALRVNRTDSPLCDYSTAFAASSLLEWSFAIKEKPEWTFSYIP